jgi:hypothetical protein
MDTEWFAVDGDGQVALFTSGENGSVPNDALPADIDEVLRVLGSTLSLEDLEDLEWDDTLAELARLGLHIYVDDTDWFSGPYVRAWRPKTPLHVDQLPPELRQQVKTVQFSDLRFATQDVLQPCDHAEGYAWASGYLAEDRKTARPIPGKEKEFREDMERMRQEYPEEYKKYHIEGLDEGD